MMVHCANAWRMAVLLAIGAAILAMPAKAQPGDLSGFAF